MDEILAGSELEAFEGFLAVIADDLREPDTAVDGDEQGSLGEADGAGMGGDARVDDPFPDFDDLCLGLAVIDADATEDGWEDIANPTVGADEGGFERAQVDATPFGEGLGAGFHGATSRTAFRTGGSGGWQGHRAIFHRRQGCRWGE